MNINISHHESGKGSIKINYTNLDQLDKVLEQLKK
jgi:hypothetical protein